MSRIAIAVAGASCSGKTTLAKSLANVLNATLIRIDDYYRPLDHLSYEERCELNFDEPEAIDHALLVEHIRQMLSGATVEAPVYDFTRHTRSESTQTIVPTSVIVIEGLFALCYPELVDLCQVRIYVDAPDDVCLDRRILRDTLERGRTEDEVTHRFYSHVAPMFRQHGEPSRAYATVCVSGERPVAASLQDVLSVMSALPR